MPHAKVTVALGTYNGENYLEEQLESIKHQTIPVRRILISDDGSTDDTTKIIKRSLPAQNILHGPQKGYAENFLFLLSQVDNDADYVALCDQDDRWFPKKLERAVSALQALERGRPALYGSGTIVCDETLSEQKLSREVDSDLIGFKHSLVQNFAGGNTFVLNKEAVKLVQKSMPSEAPVHDWWIYIIISGAGGRIVYESEPSLFYRQHKANVIGANSRFVSHLCRLKGMLGGAYQHWNDQNFKALDEAYEFLTPEAQKTFGIVKSCRNSNIIQRLSLPIFHGLKRQGFIAQAGLYLSLVLNKF